MHGLSFGCSVVSLLEIRPGVNTGFNERNIVGPELGGICVAYLGIFDGGRYW